MKVGKQSYELTNTYVVNTAVAIGKVEALGKMKCYSDIIYEDTHFGCQSFEQAERKMQKDTLDKLKSKELLIDLDIDLVFGGDLINQEIITTHTMKDYDIPFIGLFGACSTFAAAVILSSLFIEAKLAKNVVAISSSHTEAAERTFRYPIEYGGAKEASTTLTVTGSGAMLISNKKTNIKVSRLTIGKVTDVGYKNVFDLGGAMAPSAIETLLTHFEDFKMKPEDYDLILTGDLSQIGRSIVFDSLNETFNNVKNYDDCGLYVYDYFDQKVYSGGSGCACCAVVTCGYIYQKLLDKELKRVLICATGALMNQTTSLQKESIPSVSHAFVLERED